MAKRELETGCLDRGRDAHEARCHAESSVKGGGKGRKSRCQYLLSDEMWDVRRFHFEGAVVRPQVDRIGDASDTTLVNLK